MSTTATINGQEARVTPTSRAEALATRRDATRLTGSGILAAILGLATVGYAALMGDLEGWDTRAAAIYAAIFSGVALALAVALHMRLRALQSDPAEWTTPPAPSHGRTPVAAPWSTVLHIPRSAWITVGVIAVLWALGLVLVRVPAVQAAALAVMAPGAILMALGSTAVIWALLSLLIYMVWSIVPVSGPRPAGQSSS